MYLVRTPKIIDALFKHRVWRIPTTDKPTLYFTFDDGPHPTHTTFVLNQLQQFNAKGTFFCIGKNVQKHQHIYQQILSEKHAIGNHTYSHNKQLVGKANLYVNDVNKAQQFISSRLFRPPYGKLSKAAEQILLQQTEPFKIIMWTVLSADFDTTISKEKCLKNVINAATDGSIIVFHDSDKAAKNLEFALPRSLEYFSKKGFSFESLK